MRHDTITRFRRLAAGLAVLGLAGLADRAMAQDPAADRLFREAQRQEANDHYGALDDYQLLLDQFPDDRLAPRALLRIVELRRADRDPQRTQLALDQLLDRYGRTPEAATGYLIRGAILEAVAEDAAGLESARAALRRVPLLFGRERFPDLGARAEAHYRSAVIARRLGDDAGATADLLAVIENEPRGAFTHAARLALGQLWLGRGAWPAAVEILQRIVDGDEASAIGDEAAAARRLLTLVDRRIIRPTAGQRLFLRARPFASGFSLDDATGIAAHADGRLLITDPGQQAVAVLDADGGVQMRATVRGLSAPFWDDDQPAALDGNGIVRPFGGRPTTLASADRGSPLKGLTRVATGTLGLRFVVAKGLPGVQRYAGSRPAGASVSSNRQEIVDLTADPHGVVYALDRKAGEVRRLNGAAGTGVVVRDTWKRPSAVAVDGLGYIYVADRSTAEIRMYDSAGNRTTTLGPMLMDGVQLRAPIDLAVDGAGRLFVLDARLTNLVVLE